MSSRDQRQALTASIGMRSRLGVGATGLRLRLIGELSAGCVALSHGTTGKLLMSPVINQR